jgi:hypothetical protein
MQVAKDALLKIMPRSKKEALMVWELLERAGIPQKFVSTAKKALQELASSGKVQRIGKGVSGNPFLVLRRCKMTERQRAQYMQEYRDRKAPDRLWPRIVRKYLGPRRTWKVKNHRRGSRAI